MRLFLFFILVFYYNVCPGLLCGLLKETTAGLEQRLQEGGGVKAVREWDRMLSKARYTLHTFIHHIHVQYNTCFF